jgi:HNH endonuclease
MDSQERIDFYSRCRDALAQQLPRKYEIVSTTRPSNYHWIYIPLPGIHFEWHFAQTGFVLALDFEKSDGEENERLLKKFEPLTGLLQERLNENVHLEFVRGERKAKWTRLAVPHPNRSREIPNDLADWAISKTRILIEECEPILKTPSNRRVQQQLAISLPEEVSNPKLFPEGATKLISVNAYERSRQAVRECKEHYDPVCIICGFDFGIEYGPDFAGFIHVHHLRPLSEIGHEYEVDPINDLRPVCPNCHAIIHHGGKLRTVEEMRRLIADHGAVICDP